MTLVSPFLTFPNIFWWAYAAQAEKILFDAYEHFEKMTFRNRYQISGSNNEILLSVPLVNGRNQHVPMNEVLIYNQEQWQLRHWRTLTSVYRRTPYFEHYEAALQPLFERQYPRLIDFNLAGIQWVRKELRMSFDMQETSGFEKEYPQYTDLRHAAGKRHLQHGNFRKYYQVFEDRIGFRANLSVLDLLFAEGPNATAWLRTLD